MKEGTMSKQMIYTTMAVWVTLVAALVGFGLSSEVLPVTLGTGVLALVIGLMPPAILLKLCGSGEPQTVAQMLRERP
jgi:hypothetical protein